MAKYLLAYKGGAMAQSDAERDALMAAWGAWFGQLGGAVLDIGNPFAVSASVASDGSVSDGAGSGLGGYSLISADSLAAAAELTKGCPVLSGGGSVDVYEAHEIVM